VFNPFLKNWKRKKTGLQNDCTEIQGKLSEIKAAIATQLQSTEMTEIQREYLGKDIQLQMISNENACNQQNALNFQAFSNQIAKVLLETFIPQENLGEQVTKIVASFFGKTGEQPPTEIPHQTSPRAHIKSRPPVYSNQNQAPIQSSVIISDPMEETKSPSSNKKRRSSIANFEGRSSPYALRSRKNGNELNGLTDIIPVQNQKNRCRSGIPVFTKAPLPETPLINQEPEKKVLVAVEKSEDKENQVETKSSNYNKMKRRSMIPLRSR